MKRLLLLLLIVVFVAGCSGNNNDENNDGENDNNNQTEENNDEENDENAETNDETSDNEENDENASGAVEPGSSEDSISFEQVSWMMGSPDRESEPGVWYYTEEEHPDDFDDTFDWEEDDILLWQIGDEKYEGASADTEELEIVDDDVIKIVVDLDEEDIDDDDDEAPRNFLEVPKDELEGKSFIVETVDGEELSVE